MSQFVEVSPTSGVTAVEKYPHLKTPKIVTIKKRAYPYLRPLVAATLIITCVTVFGLIDLFKSYTSNDNITQLQNYSIQTTTSPQFFVTDDPNPEKPDCKDVTAFAGDRCEYVSENCDPEGLVNWMKFAYCTFSIERKLNSIAHKSIVLIVFTCLLSALLMLLSSSADIWLVPSLEMVSGLFQMSPAIAGLTLLSFANSTPDIITSLTSLRQGAEDGEVGLVLGSLSGATMCICCLTLGLALVAANNKTLLSKSSFLRSMSGLVCCVFPTLFLCWLGNLRWWHGAIMIGLYAIYLIGSILLLQKQEARKKRVSRDNRKKAFLSSTVSYRQLFPDTETSSSNKNTVSESHQGFLSHDGEAFPPESDTNFLTGGSILQFSPRDATLSGLGYQNDAVSPGFSINQLDADPESPTGGANDPTNDLIGGDAEEAEDDDDDDNVDTTYFMSGLFINPNWKKIDESNGKRKQNVFLRNLSRTLWVIFWPFYLLRWASIPATDHRPDYLRGPKKLALHISPFFAPFVVTLFLLGPSDKLKVWGFVALIAAILSIISNLAYFFIVMPAVKVYDQERAKVQLYVDSTRDAVGLTEEELEKVSELMIKYHLDLGDSNSNNEQAKPFAMTLYMIFISAVAFISSVAWLGIIAQEIVEVLLTLGLIFKISTSFLGLSALAIGNSIPDAASDISLAKKGHMAIAYSAIWSAPVLSNALGLGLSTLVATAKVPTIAYKVNQQLIFCWISVVVSIIATIVAFLFIYKRQPPSKFGYVLIAMYVLFLVGAIIFERFGH